MIKVNRQHGFTLLELMAAICIVAILLGIAVPSFREFTASTRVTATTNSLVSALNIARSEALRRSTPVSVCSSTDAATCLISPDWSKGWIVFTDVNTNGTVDSGDQLVQAWPAPGGGLSVNAAVQAGGAAVPFISYDPRGMTTLAGTVALSIWKSGCTGAHQSQLLVTVTGSIQSSYVACP